MFGWLLDLFRRQFEAGARGLSLLHNWASSILSAFREGHFGKLFAWSTIVGAVSLCGSYLKLGFSQSLAILRGVASDPVILSSDASGLLNLVSQSLSPWWNAVSTTVPEFWRWLGWWIGVDWVLWLLACSALFAASAWLMGILVRCVAAVVRIVLRFV